MHTEDYAEDYGLFNPTVRRRGILNKMMQYSKWNPLFYCSVFFTIFAFFAFIVHATWAFATGIIFAILTVFFGAWCTYICVVGKYKKPWSGLSKKETAKVLIFGLVCLTGQGLLVWGHSVLIGIHFSGTDPYWTTFPSSCDSSSYCVRVGINIPEPNGAEGLNPIAPPAYNGTTVDRIFALYKDAAKKMGCHEVGSDSGSEWAHYRCLTPVLGERSDLAFQILIPGDIIYGIDDTNNNTYTQVVPWIHSQSSDWNDNVNDANVRLLISYVYYVS